MYRTGMNIVPPSKEKNFVKNCKIVAEKCDLSPLGLIDPKG